MRVSIAVILGIACVSYVAALPQGYQSEEPYPAHEVPSKKFETGFIDCQGKDQVCVAKKDCVNGYVSSNQLNNQDLKQKCERASQVCCSLRNDVGASSNVVANAVLPEQNGGIFGSRTHEIEEEQVNNGYLPPLGSAPSSNVDAFAEPPKEPSESSGSLILGPHIDPPFKIEPQLGCAAALLCVEEIYCTMDGVISKTPVTITPDQLFRRVPMVDCRNPENGVVGKCCRDPDYVDPWPTGNLPANYSGGFDEQGFPNFLNLSRKQNKPARPFQQPIAINRRPQPINVVQAQQPGESFQPSINFESVRIPASRPNPVSQPRPIVQQFPTQRPEPVGTDNQLLLGAGVQPPSPIGEQFNQVQPIPEQSRTQSINVNLPIPPSRPSNINILVPDNTLPQRPQQFNVARRPINAGINAQFQPAPAVFDAQPSTNVKDFIVPHQPGTQCGRLNQIVNRPQNLRDIDAAFGEIPWQAMILNNVERKLLCSGTIIAPNVVLTAAHCVYGYNPKIVSVKSGEWKLGYELKHEEPLPFEILNVTQIVAHPGYRPGSASHNVAMLFLSSSFNLDQHVDTLCIGELKPVTPDRKCISTGWGKLVLQSHLAGALMHKLDVDVITDYECRGRLAYSDTNLDIDDSIVCTKSHDEEKSMCLVDVGGPLACDRGDGFYELAGIYIYENDCHPENQVTTFAMIDANWVNEMLTNGPRPTYGIQSVDVQTISTTVSPITVGTLIPQQPAVIITQTQPQPIFLQQGPSSTPQTYSNIFLTGQYQKKPEAPVNTPKPFQNVFINSQYPSSQSPQGIIVQSTPPPRPQPNPFIQSTIRPQPPQPTPALVVQSTPQPPQQTYVFQSTPKPSQPTLIVSSTPQPPQQTYVFQSTPKPSQPNYVFQSSPKPSQPSFVVSSTPQPPQQNYVFQSSPKPSQPNVVVSSTPQPPQKNYVFQSTPKPPTYVFQSTPQRPQPNIIVSSTPQPPQQTYVFQSTPKPSQPNYVFQSSPAPSQPTFAPQQPQKPQTSQPSYVVDKPAPEPYRPQQNFNEPETLPKRPQPSEPSFFIDETPRPAGPQIPFSNVQQPQRQHQPTQQTFEVQKPQPQQPGTPHHTYGVPKEYQSPILPVQPNASRPAQPAVQIEEAKPTQPEQTFNNYVNKLEKPAQQPQPAPFAPLQRPSPFVPQRPQPFAPQQQPQPFIPQQPVSFQPQAIQPTRPAPMLPQEPSRPVVSLAPQPFVPQQPNYSPVLPLHLQTALTVPFNYPQQNIGYQYNQPQIPCDCAKSNLPSAPNQYLPPN